MRVLFSSAAATLSRSANCLLTWSSWLCVPALTLTSTRKFGGNDCSNRTRTPKPIAVASEQCVMVGVISTSTRVKVSVLGRAGEGVIWMSGKLTTASDPRVRGCSGSEMVEMRSGRLLSVGEGRIAAAQTYRKFLARQ